MAGEDARRGGTRRLLLWALVVLVALLAAVRLFWLREYPVRSSSMEPTILGSADGGELVLVEFDGERLPARFDLVVVRVPGRPDPLVKRAAALPGESVEIRHGDLFIDGERLPADEPRPAPVLMFDDTLLALTDWFRVGSTDRNPWRAPVEPRGGEWLLAAEDVPRGTNAGMMFLRKELKDGYLLADGTCVPGEVKVDDAIVAVEVLVEDPPALLRLDLHEKGDTFEVALEPLEDGRAGLRLTRRASGAELEPLASATAPFARDAWHELAFSNVDNTLSFRLDGVELLACTYDENVPHPDEVRRQTILMQSYGHRVSLGGEAGRARFRRIRVWRDLFYTPDGTVAVREPLQLGPREIFVLGDNSSSSVDGRFWGPNTLRSVVGRPLWVMWPPGHARRLSGAQLPAGYPVR